MLVPARQGITVEGYREGDTLIFSGERHADGRVERWGARLNTEGKVTGLDRERNLVRVSYSFSTKRAGRETTRSITKEFSAAELSGRSTLYREEERSFAVGDRIVALKNDAKIDLQNGTLGVIRELDQSGRARVALGEREIDLDLNRYRHIDHAYAVTIHKSQGATVEHSIMYAPVRPDVAQEIVPSDEQYGRTSYNALNVAVTRAQFEAHLFTNSVQGLARSVELVDRKTSTLNRLPEPERGIASPKSQELGAKLNELEKVMKSPVQPAKVLPAVSAAVNPGRELERTISKTIGLELEK